jgi:hypothetical protein
MIQLGVLADLARSRGFRLPEIDDSAVVAPVTAQFSLFCLGRQSSVQRFRDKSRPRDHLRTTDFCPLTTDQLSQSAV